MISFLNKLFNRMKPVTAQPQKRGRKLWEPTSPVDWSRPSLHIAVEQGVAIKTIHSGAAPEFKQATRKETT